MALSLESISALAPCAGASPWRKATCAAVRSSLNHAGPEPFGPQFFIVIFMRRARSFVDSFVSFMCAMKEVKMSRAMMAPSAHHAASDLALFSAIACSIASASSTHCEKSAVASRLYSSLPAKSKQKNRCKTKSR